MLRRLRPERIGRCEEGAIFVEFAIVVPVLILLCVGLFEFSRVFTSYHFIDKSMRSATRYLARVPADAVTNWGLERARCLATRGVVASEANCDAVGACIFSGWCDAAARTTIALNPAQLSSDPPKITLTATVPLQFPLLSLFGASTSLSFVVSHEETHIGE